MTRFFTDYEEQDIMPHLVKTEFYDKGLNDEHVKQAIDMLNHLPEEK